MHTPIFAAIALILSVPLMGLTQQATPAPAEARPQAAPLAPLAFLAGAWSSTDESGLAEEHWSAPHANSIMGMFRWCKPNGDPAMFEILTISSEAEGIVLRLRHFSPKLVAKEEKEAPMTFVLESAANAKAVFKARSGAGTVGAISYHSPTPDRLLVTVAFTRESQKEPLKFDLRRQPATPLADPAPKK